MVTFKLGRGSDEKNLGSRDNSKKDAGQMEITEYLTEYLSRDTRASRKDRRCLSEMGTA